MTKYLFLISMVATLLVGNLSDNNGEQQDSVSRRPTIETMSEKLTDNDSTTKELEQAPTQLPDEGFQLNIQDRDDTNNLKLSEIIALITGVLTLFTIIAMIIIHHRESKGTNDEIDELKNQNKKLSKLISDQKKQSLEAVLRSDNLNRSLRENVSDIKNYMLQKDLIIKLKERKSSIYKLFGLVSNHNIRGSEIKNGTTYSNPAILYAISKIIQDISAVNELLPTRSNQFNILVSLCYNDLDSISKEQNDPVKWIRESREHFAQLDNEINNLIEQINNNQI